MGFLYPFAPSTFSHRRSSSRHSSHSRSRSKDSSLSRSSHKHKHRSSSRSSTSRAQSIFSLSPSANRSTLSSVSSTYSKPSAYTGAGSNYDSYRMGSPSVFSSHSSSSSRRAKPRSGLVARLVRKIRRLLRSIVHYAKKHPVKVFFMVVLPLITGGVLQKLLGFLGVRVPRALRFGRSRGGGGYDGGYGGLGGEGIRDGLNGVVSLARMFV